MRGLLFAGLVQLSLHGFGQEKPPVTFGKVAPEDFVVRSAVADTSADVIVLSDVGISSFERKDLSALLWDGYLQHTKRALIQRRRGFEAATVTIPLYMFKGEEEEITELKAATYNLEGGKVVRTELDKSSIFKEKLSENWMVERFTFPQIREGTIVEYSYTQRSPFLFNHHTWPFQSKYPCLWSEYSVGIPSVFSYNAVKHATLSFCIETTEAKRADFGQFYGEIKTFRWAVKDIPALKEEPYTTTINNYVSRVDVQVEGAQKGGIRGVLMGWARLDQTLMKNEHFGADLTAGNSWLDKDMKAITAGAGNDLEKAQKIYRYVRDTFTCNGHGGLMLSSSLKTIYKNRAGSEAELNLLLTALLEHEKLDASPVLLSTRSNGFMEKLFAQPSQLNYVICKLKYGSTVYYLDASDPNVGYGQLPLQCYNGSALEVGSTIQLPDAVLSADSVTEQKKVTVFLSNGEKGGLDGSVQSFPGMDEAAAIRKKMKAEDGEKKFRDQLRNGLTAEETVSDLEIDSLRLPDEPLVISYSCHVTADSASDIFYFTPMLVDRITENPFKATERTYPVEMPYARDVNYILTMEVPSGYVVDELPKSARVTLIDNSGFFEYILSQDGDQINFRTRMRLMKANYGPQEYAILRNFFAAIVDKEGEQIVFKKKK